MIQDAAGVSSLLGTSSSPQLSPLQTLLGGQSASERTTNLFGAGIQRAPSPAGEMLDSASSRLGQFIQDNVEGLARDQLLGELAGLEQLARLNGKTANGLDPALSLLQGNNSLASGLPAGTLTNQLV